MRAAIVAALVCAVGVSAVPASAASKQVRYGRYAIRVPASWPVHDLAEHPRTCVRFDRHAVYLGVPGAEQRCPAHAVGRSESILVEPRSETSGRALGPSVRAPRGDAAPRQLPMSGPAAALRVDVPSAGVSVTATWRRHRETVRRILDRARLRPGRPPAPPQRVEKRTVLGAAVSRASFHKGLGFDACAAPSRSAMSAWTSSPYSAVGVYIGGANRGCSQPNLTSGWVRRVTSSGWALMPIYVGLQAPGTSCNCATISRRAAKSQGRAAAKDAIADASALGLGPGSPIYFDMEYYARSSTNSRTALRFLAAWTRRLHDAGYVSGVYSSAGAGIHDLAGRYGSRYPVPDDIWIANWDGRRTTDDPYVPDRYWSNHQRIRQFRGSHNESYRGVTINVDSNYVDGAVAGAADGDGDSVPNDFDLCAKVRGPLEHSGCPYPHVSGGLVNYLDSVEGDRYEGDHFTTTGGVPAAYRFQANLGFLPNARLGGTAAVYSCTATGDQFLALNSACGGATVLGPVGYAYGHGPAGLPARAIYSCRTATSEQTVSYAPDCGDPAATNLGRLGFTISVAMLGRYFDSVKGDRHEGDHFTTTGGVAPAYRFQADLGVVFTQRLAGTVPLYSCTANRDQFLSRDPACGGATVLGLVGYVYAHKPRGLPAGAIYRCRIAKTGELTVSDAPDCDDPAATREGRLGFTVSVATLGRYFDSVDGDRREGDHFTTTGRVGRNYHYQGNLGFLLTQRVAGTAPLYSCIAKRDQFLSRAADCGGAKVRGVIGWIYSSARAGTPSRAIYGCRSRTGERFVSVEPTCGRSSDESPGRLGYTSVTPLPR
jgi:hypothetical protein